jgi:dipeptidyl aminopeptidase/acylaminoacyl peptidase
MLSEVLPMTRPIICRGGWATLLVLGLTALGSPAEGQERVSPVEYPDIFRLVSIASWDLSSDGEWIVYETRRAMPGDWRPHAHLALASTDGRVRRQLTYSSERQDRSPVWHPDGRFIGFSGTSDGSTRLHLLDRAGGGPWTIGSPEDELLDWAWSPDGSHLAVAEASGEGSRLVILPPDGRGTPEVLVTIEVRVQNLEWFPGGEEILVQLPEAPDRAQDRRHSEGFGVTLVDEPDRASHLWSVDVSSGETRQLTEGRFSVGDREVSPDGRWLAFRANTVERHKDERWDEYFLLDLETGRLEQITEPEEVPHRRGGQTEFAFSPDSRELAVVMPREWNEYFRSNVQRVFVRPAAGGEWARLPVDFDLEASLDFWSDDGTSIYFNGHDGVNRNVYSIDARTGRWSRVTDVEGVVAASFHRQSGTVVLTYEDPGTPPDLWVTSLDGLGDRSRWVQVTDENPWVRARRLAEYETIHWTSEDGSEIEGILIHPLDYEPGRSYPLIAQIHGGPASAYVNSFGMGHGTYPHILSAHGYAVFQPNYRGSTGYGETFKTEISGNYFQRAFEDIMTGVDMLIDRGLAHPDSLAMMGWSAGGHWSNWTLVNTDRFRAISSGAGGANWISMYGNTDSQDSREFYFGGDGHPDATGNQPWDDYEHWWSESPLKYVKNASTPTLIHFGELDVRVPTSQGYELHMALKKLGVPTEFLVYPGQPHGIQEPRFRLVKMMAELGWFEQWVRGSGEWLDWEAILREGERIEEQLKWPWQESRTVEDGGGALELGW